MILKVKMLTIVLQALLLYFTIHNHQKSAEASRTNFQITRFGICNKTQGVIKYYANITKEGNEYYLNHEMISPVIWGDNLGVSCMIESALIGNNYLELFTIREKNICKAAHVYMGEFWYELMRAAGHPNPKGCPIPGGRTHVNHLKLDFQKITLQTFPFGKLRFTIRAIDIKNPSINMWCIVAEVQNLIEN